jgi:hypothetical protein
LLNSCACSQQQEANSSFQVSHHPLIVRLFGKNQFVADSQVKLKVVHRSSALSPAVSSLTNGLDKIFVDLQDIAGMIEQQIDVQTDIRHRPSAEKPS